MHDAVIVAMRNKRAHNGARPVSVIRHRLRNQTVLAWAGSGVVSSHLWKELTAGTVPAALS